VSIAVLDGSLSVGPDVVSDSSFPSGTHTEPLSLAPQKKLVNASTGTLERNLASAGSFATLSGVGPTDTVQQGTLLYVRVAGGSGFQIRLTLQDPGGGSDIVSILPIDGTQMFEFPSNGYLKGLEAKGNGKIVYLIAGPQ
jgi:hypothetical protein